MRVVEVFKSETEEERREAVTKILIKYEADKPKDAGVRRSLKPIHKPLKAG